MLTREMYVATKNRNLLDEISTVGANLFSCYASYRYSISCFIGVGSLGFKGVFKRGSFRHPQPDFIHPLVSHRLSPWPGSERRI